MQHAASRDPSLREPWLTRTQLDRWTAWVLDLEDDHDGRAVPRGHIVAPRGRPAAVQSESRARPHTRQDGGAADRAREQQAEWNPRRLR
jgi:hypothetical protein